MKNWLLFLLYVPCYSLYVNPLRKIAVEFVNSDVGVHHSFSFSKSSCMLLTLGAFDFDCCTLEVYTVNFFALHWLISTINTYINVYAVIEVEFKRHWKFLVILLICVYLPMHRALFLFHFNFFFLTDVRPSVLPYRQPGKMPILAEVVCSPGEKMF